MSKTMKEICICDSKHCGTETKEISTCDMCGNHMCEMHSEYVFTGHDSKDEIYVCPKCFKKVQKKILKTISKFKKKLTKNS